MAVFLLVLKIIGIVLLCVLCVVVALLAIILFAPISYTLSGKMHGEEMAFRARVCWLLHLVVFGVGYEEGEFGYGLKILGIKAWPRDKDKKKRKKKDKDKDKEKKGADKRDPIEKYADEAEEGGDGQNQVEKHTEEAERGVDASDSATSVKDDVDSASLGNSEKENSGKTPHDNVSAERCRNAAVKLESGRAEEVAEISNAKNMHNNASGNRHGQERDDAGSDNLEREEHGNETKQDQERDDSAGREEESEEPAADRQRQKSKSNYDDEQGYEGNPASAGKKKSRKGIFKKIRESLSSLREKITNLREKAGSIKAAITDERNKRAVSLIFKELKRLLGHFRFRKVRADVDFSLGNPATTGLVLGVIALFPFIYKGDVRISPDFEAEKAYGEGDVFIRGRVQLIFVLISVIRLVLKKDVRRLVKKILKK